MDYKDYEMKQFLSYEKKSQHFTRKKLQKYE